MIRLGRVRALGGGQRLLAASVAMFLAITAVRLIVNSPGWGFTLLYDVPVALIAVGLGLRAGVAAAGAGMALFTLVDVTRPVVVAGVEVHQNAAGYTSRAVVFVVLGVLLGAFADRLRATERQLAGVLDSTSDPIVGADARGVIIGFNRAAEETFARSAAETIGRPLTVLMPERYREPHSAGVRRFLDTRDPHVIGTTVELSALRADGSEFPMELSLTTFELRGEPYFTGVVSDITERRRVEQERAAHQADLERSNAELEQFAYVASHDLQEPLRSVSGFAALISKRYVGRLDDDADRYMGFITDGVTRMQALIDGLLLYSRAGRDDLAAEPVDLNAVLQGAAAAVEGARAERDGEIHLEHLPTVTGDSSALGRVFQNLLGNALKFTDGAAPRVDVGAERSDNGWTVTVRDNGIGIDPEHAERIFRMFQRLHGRAEYEGTGIGLAVSRTIVERQGGRIWCEAPDSGPGTAFRVFLPDQVDQP